MGPTRMQAGWGGGFVKVYVQAKGALIMVTYHPNF